MLVYVVLNLFSNILEQMIIQFCAKKFFEIYHTKKCVFWSDLGQLFKIFLELMLKEVCCYDFNF